MGKRMLIAFMLVISVALLTACGVEVSNNQQPATPPTDSIVHQKDNAEKVKHGIPSNIGGKILVLSLQDGEICRYFDDTIKCVTAKIDVDCLELSSGEKKTIRSLSSLDTKSCTIELPRFNGRLALRFFFNDELSLAAASVNMSNGTSHVGWIDQNGYFTDVTNILYPNDENKSQWSPWFYGGYFYFVEGGYIDEPDFHGESTGTGFIKKVPINDLTADSVFLLPRDYTAGYWGDFEDFYFHDVYPNNKYFTDDEVNAYTHEYIVARSDGIYLINFDTSKEKRLVSSGNSKICSSPVLSPDHNYIAFLAYSALGYSEMPQLYIVPFSGGEPLLINASFDSGNIALLSWQDN